MAGKRRSAPEINAGSMADIAFLLLIFFLVTTTMDFDKGLLRMLPPPLPENQDPPPEIKERNVFQILVNSQDQLLVNGEPLDILQLKDKAELFIVNVNDAPDLPAKEPKDIPLLGNQMVSKQVISLQNDRGTSYEMYIHVQNELIAAYNEVRNKAAQQFFGKSYKKLDDNQRKAIKTLYPQRISEAEPHH